MSENVYQIDFNKPESVHFIGIGGIIKVVQTKAGMGWLIVVAVIVIFAFVMPPL